MRSVFGNRKFFEKNIYHRNAWRYYNSVSSIWFKTKKSSLQEPIYYLNTLNAIKVIDNYFFSFASDFIFMEKIMHETELITALKEGDKNAIGLVYDNYGAALYGVVLRIVQSPEAAEEVVQDVFVKIFKNIQSFDENKGKFYTWAINIAKNTAIDATRTSDFKNRQKTEQFDFVVYSQTHPSSNLSVDTIGLREIVDKLDEKHRAVIDLAYFQGYTQSEIEEEMNIPIGTVKTRLRLAIKELRKAFG